MESLKQLLDGLGEGGSLPTIPDSFTKSNPAFLLYVLRFFLVKNKQKTKMCEKLLY